MDTYAIVQIDHRQYIVEPDKTYTVDKFASEPGQKMDLDVLAYGNGDKFEAGEPVLSGKKVSIEVVEHGKGEKITSRIFKAKSRYHKTTGFRKQTTTFKVVSIK